MNYANLDKLLESDEVVTSEEMMSRISANDGEGDKTPSSEPSFAPKKLTLS